MKSDRLDGVAYILGVALCDSHAASVSTLAPPPLYKR